MKERNFRENRKKNQRIWSYYEIAIPHTSFNPGSKEENRTIHVLFIWIHLVIHYPYVCLLFPYEYSWTDKENTNFPVCSQISLCFYKTDKKIWIFLCVHEFSCEYLPNRQRKSLFPCFFIIFSGSFHTTDGPEWIFLCVWLFPVSLSVTDKETWISLWVAEKTRREIRHTQRKNSFQ